jgi:hyperosmotically inducible protein
VVDEIAVRTSEHTGDAPDSGRSLGEKVDDAGITMAVKTRLLDDPDVKGSKIDVDTREGIVYLTGTVRSESEKSKAVELARNTKGVRDVQPNLDIKGS